MTNHFDNVARDWDKNVIHIKRTNVITSELLNNFTDYLFK